MSRATDNIWHYAQRLEKALISIAPANMQCRASGENSFRIECTITTLPEAEAVREIIKQMTKGFPSNRVGSLADIGVLDEPPPDPFAAAMALLGAAASKEPKP